MTIENRKLNAGFVNDQFFYDTDRQKYLGAILAAAVWPGEKPGFISILGQELASFSQPKPPIYELAWFESTDLTDLFRRLLEFQADFKLQSIYAPLNDSVRHFLLHFNDEQQKQRRANLYLEFPPHYLNGEISYVSGKRGAYIRCVDYLLCWVHANTKISEAIAACSISRAAADGRTIPAQWPDPQSICPAVWSSPGHVELVAQ